MLEQLNLREIMFLDIETVPAFPEFYDQGEEFQKHWDKKSSYFRTEEQSAADVYARAGIYAEFGKIICISIGMFNKDNKFILKSFASDNEKQLLSEFVDVLLKWDRKSGTQAFCGHNIKEFDIPYISRRLLVNNLKIPNIINCMGKKPWEIRHIDTLDLWKFGDYKHFTSLSLLADLFGIPTPKDDIDGSQVYEVYYKENNLARITEYCEKDVVCVANLLLKMQGKDCIDSKNIDKV